MYYTRITLFCASVIIVPFLNGINCVDKENVLATNTIQPWIGIGQSGFGRVTAPFTMQQILNPPSSIITPRKDVKIVKPKGQTLVFTLKKHPKIVLLREVRHPPKQLNRPKRPMHQRRGIQQANAAVFNQQRAIENQAQQQRIREQQAQQERIRQQQAQQERLREQQTQQQRFIENQAQQQTIFSQNAFQQQFPIPTESQFFFDQRIRNEQQAQHESFRQQAFLDTAAEQERISYLQKKRREQYRPRRFPDGLIDPERVRNQNNMREKQRELALQQKQVNSFAVQQSFIPQQQSNYQTQQPQVQQLSGAASQQQNWIYHPQALNNANTLQQLSEQEKYRLQLAQQQAFRNERPAPSLRKIPKQPKQRQRKIILRIIAKE